MIGAGRTSQIIVSKIHDYTCIVKKIPKSLLFEQGELKHILNERDTLYATNSPFLMKLFAEVEDAQYAYFICEYIPGGELRSVMSDYVLFSEDMTFFYACEIVVALEHLYDHQIVYRDLVPENICIDEYGHIKLIDFGSSINVNYNANGKLYTLALSSPKYLSPEQLNSKYEGGYGAEVDWWALGICLYEFVTGKTPFVKSEKDDSQYEILIRILRHKLSFPVTFPLALRELVNKLLTPTMDTRLYDPKLIKQHTYFTSRLPNWDCVLQRRLAPPFVPNLSFDHYDSNYFSMSQKSKKHWKMDVLENDTRLR
jgi:serine/threonine protein kinase